MKLRTDRSPTAIFHHFVAEQFRRSQCHPGGVCERYISADQRRSLLSHLKLSPRSNQFTKKLTNCLSTLHRKSYTSVEQGMRQPAPALQSVLATNCGCTSRKEKL